MKLSKSVTTKALVGVITTLTAYHVSSSPDTNVILYVNAEWSLDRTNWHPNNIPNQDLWYQIGPGSAYLVQTNTDQYFFLGETANEFEVVYDETNFFRVIDFRVLFGTNVNQLTNVFSNVEELIKPTLHDMSGSNVFYRPFLSLTNYTLQNTNTGILQDTNPPTGP